MKSDPELLDKGEDLKEELLDHPEFRAWIESLWLGPKGLIRPRARSQQRTAAVRIDVSLQRLGERLASEPELQHKIDRWVRARAGYVVEHYRSEVADMIASTVEQWDGESTARRMELQVGRDLQFIRINGTIVGGLAGITIHAITDLLRGTSVAWHRAYRGARIVGGARTPRRSSAPRGL